MELFLLSMFSLIIGLVLCLWGYRAFLVMLPVFGFFAGLWLGVQGVALIFGSGFVITVTSLVVGLILGVIFAVLSYLFYFVGVALVALGFGATLGVGLLGAMGIESTLVTLIVAMVLALIVAGFTLVFNLQKYVIIAITAVGGANAVVLSPLLLFGRVSVDGLSGAGNTIRPILQDSWLWLIIWLVVAGGSIVYQIRNNRDYVFNRDVYVEGWG